MATNETLLTNLANVSAELADLKKRQVRWMEATVTAVDTVGHQITIATPDAEGGGTLSGIAWPAQFLPAVGATVRLIVAGAQPMHQASNIAANAVTGIELADASVGASHFEPLIVLGSAFIAGDPAGQHTTMDDTGIYYSATTPEGIPYEASRFGKDAGGTDSLGNTTWTIEDDGDASFNSLDVTNEPVFAGTPLSEWVLDNSGIFYAGGSRGNQTNPASSGTTQGEVGYYEVTMELYGDHQYEIKTSNVWVRGSTTTPANRIDMNIHYTVSTDPAVDPPSVSNSSPIFSRASIPISNNLGGQLQIDKLFRPGVPYAHFRFLLSLSYFGGGGYINMGAANSTDATLGGQVIEPDAVQVFALDLGAVPWTNRAVTNDGGYTGATPPTTSVKRYTYDYFATWTRRFRGDNTVHSDSGDAVQGQTPYYTSNGNQKTQIGDFRRAGNIQLVPDLAGATIEKMQVYLYASSWHYNSGGTAIIRYHNNPAPTTYINVSSSSKVVGSWPRAAGKWVDITDWASAFQGTGAKGIQVGPGTSTDPIYYGTFNGHTGAQPPRIRVTYTR